MAETRTHRRLRVQLMGFSTGGYNFELAALAKKATRGKTTSEHLFMWERMAVRLIHSAAADAVYALLSITQKDIVPYLQVDGEYINDKHASSTCQLTRPSSIRFRSKHTAHRRTSTNHCSHVESMQRLARLLPIIECDWQATREFQVLM